MADLNHRARKILQAVVQEYLHTGDAVGSRTLTRRYGIELSPATVRNVMSDLEDLGLLDGVPAAEGVGDERSVEQPGPATMARQGRARTAS